MSLKFSNALSQLRDVSKGMEEHAQLANYDMKLILLFVEGMKMIELTKR